jgi:hypothetical protein
LHQRLDNLPVGRIPADDEQSTFWHLSGGFLAEFLHAAGP